MSRRRLTIDQARHLPFEDLVREVYGLLEPFEAPEIETPDERDTRIGKTLDLVPDIYAWFLQLHAYFDHWTEWQANQLGQRALEYKDMRVKRDLMENAASAAKRRYEGASRRLTQERDHEEAASMRHGR